MRLLYKCNFRDEAKSWSVGQGKEHKGQLTPPVPRAYNNIGSPPSHISHRCTDNCSDGHGNDK